MYNRSRQSHSRANRQPRKISQANLTPNHLRPNQQSPKTPLVKMRQPKSRMRKSQLNRLRLRSRRQRKPRLARQSKSLRRSLRPPRALRMPILSKWAKDICMAMECRRTVPGPNPICVPQRLTATPRHRRSSGQCTRPGTALAAIFRLRIGGLLAPCIRIRKTREFPLISKSSGDR